MKMWNGGLACMRTLLSVRSFEQRTVAAVAFQVSNTYPSVRMPQHASSQRRRFDAAVLATALDSALSAGDASLRETARTLGLAPSTLTRIRRGGRPDAEAAVVLMEWLGLTPADVLT